TEEESNDNLADAVAGDARRLLDLLEADAIDPLGDQHPSAAHTGNHVGDEDERVSAPSARERALRLSLVFVVELLADTLAELEGCGGGIEARRKPLRGAHDQPQVL